ncbi:MAG TPA: hypothetical protein VFI08_09440 [Spirochaetia bacterium]|nr:hypothetical protein [Spirochaetia bacterium]
MGIVAFAQDASRLGLGAFATFGAILLWSRTRDLAWTFLIIAAILTYADIVLGTLRSFGILGEDLLTYRGVPVLQIALADLPLLFIGLGFLLAALRKRAV